LRASRALLFGVLAGGLLNDGHRSAVDPIKTDKKGMAEYLAKQRKMMAGQPVSKRKQRKKLGKKRKKHG